MSQPGPRAVEHEIKVLAPAEAVYQVIAEVANWPQIFRRAYTLNTSNVARRRN